MNKINEFYKEFDEDMDRLYQEEVSSLLTKKKYKRRLKYPESFYDHWKKKLKELVMYYEAKGYNDGKREAIALTQKKTAEEIFKDIENMTIKNADTPPILSCPSLDDGDDDREYFTAIKDYYKLKQKYGVGA